MVGVLVSIVVDRGVDSWSGQTKDYQIGICCFFDRHLVTISKKYIWIDYEMNDIDDDK
jgi:hypothetical protein